MTDKLVVDVSTGEEKLTPLTLAEQAELVAFQQANAAKKQADATARAAIGFDPTDNAVDIAKAQQYVQAANNFLGEGAHTNASITAQVERNTRAIRAILKQLLPGTVS